MFVFIWALFKNASLPWSLHTGEQALQQQGFTILDPAANRNVHVMGRRSNPDVIVTVVCTRLGQNPTSVVIHAVSPDEAAARISAEQVREHIRRAVSLENDVVLNPVQE
jgi:O-acetyl-ADP-ribose deacetylase (regulator of RNase III)